jgi:hypothetical protein
MDEYGYEFHASFGKVLAADLVYAIRHVPVLGGVLHKKLSRDMTRRTLQTILTLNTVAVQLLEKVNEKALERLSQGDAPLSEAEIGALLDALRTEDVGKWRHKEKTLFHTWFHPSK